MGPASVCVPEQGSSEPTDLNAKEAAPRSRVVLVPEAAVRAAGPLGHSQDGYRRLASPTFRGGLGVVDGRGDVGAVEGCGVAEVEALSVVDAEVGEQAISRLIA